MKNQAKHKKNELQSLADLSPLPRSDEPTIRALFPKESTYHTGRMRVALARELIQRYGGTKLEGVIVADPMAGTGSTGVAAAIEGCAGFVGCELVKHWANLAGVAIKNKKTLKYTAWAEALFESFPTDQPVLRQPIYFWADVWDKDRVGVWQEFGSTRLGFLEYLMIGVASALYPDTLLNREGQSRN